MSIIQKTGVGVRHDSKQKEHYRQLSKGCEMYDPCPINYQCINKAAHLYQRCAGCEVPHAAHNHKARAWAIRRENFAITISDDVGEMLKDMTAAVHEREEKVR